jgi:hypothetical protein
MVSLSFEGRMQDRFPARIRFNQQSQHIIYACAEIS